jgi:hypothetical protein
MFHQRIVQKKSPPTEFLHVQRLGHLRKRKIKMLVYVSLKKYIEHKHCLISHQNFTRLKSKMKTNPKKERLVSKMP